MNRSSIDRSPRAALLAPALRLNWVRSPREVAVDSSKENRRREDVVRCRAAGMTNSQPPVDPGYSWQFPFASLPRHWLHSSPEVGFVSFFSTSEPVG